MNPQNNSLQFVTRLAPLGTQSAAEAQQRLFQRSVDIAAHLGIPASAVYRISATNPVYWQHLERRWMTECFGPLAPRHQIAQQAREDRQALRTVRRLARLRASCPDQVIGTDQDQLVPGAFLLVPGDCFWESDPAEADNAEAAPSWWQRWTLGLMTLVSKLTGAACLLATLYLVPVWLMHHGYLSSH